MSKIGSAASEEKSFENVNGRTDDGRKVITIAHPEQSSGKLKTKQKNSLMNISTEDKLLLTLTLVLLNPDVSSFANSVDPDQLASEEAN